MGKEHGMTRFSSFFCEPNAVKVNTIRSIAAQIMNRESLTPADFSSAKSNDKSSSESCGSFLLQS
ncbi:hypothetical protein ACSBR1_035783 [Camellia fascicularis]